MERKAYQRSQAWEKFEILETVAACPLSARKACQELGISRSTYQRWRRAYRQRGLEGLKDIPPIPHYRPQRKTEEERRKVLECAKAHTQLGPRSLAPYLWDEYEIPISAKTIYNILKAEGWVRQKRQRAKSPQKELPSYPEVTGPTQVWQADFMFVYIDGYGFYQLLTFLDAWSRLPVHHELMALASSEAAARVLGEAVKINGTAPHIVVTDNASTFVNLKGKKLTLFQAACGQLGIGHRRIPFGYPQSIGRIERFHRTLREEEIGLHRYSNPEEARERIRTAIETYSTQRYHQGIGDIKPIDRHQGRQEEILARREELFSSIKRNGRKPKILVSV